MFALDAMFAHDDTPAMRVDYRSFLIAWAATFVVVTAGMAGLGVLWGNRRVHDLQRGWNLQGVVVAARDLPLGTVLAPTDLTTRQVPEQFVITALRDSELQRPVGKRLTLALKRNDLISPWMLKPRPLTPTCVEDVSRAAIAAHLDGSGEVAAAMIALGKRIDAADGGVDGR